jgi:xanthine/uracil permease
VRTQANGNGYTQVQEDGRSVGELFRELGQDARNLVQLELALAKTEMSQKASKMGKDAGFMAAGGFIMYAGFLAIMAALIIGLANFIPAWLSALIVGAVVAAIGYVLVKKGMDGLKQESVAPKETIETLKEDKDWAREQVR